MQVLYISALAVFLSACGADDRPARWDYIHEAILRPSCATVSCHTGANAVGGVNLESRFEAYAILTGRACSAEERPDEAALRNYVAPGDPARSHLVHLLLGENVRRSMPPDRLLPLQDVELIETWIAEGASCD